MKKVILGILLVLFVSGCSTAKTAESKSKESSTEISQSSTIESSETESSSTIESTSEEEVKYKMYSYKTLDPDNLIATTTNEAHEKNLEVDEILRSTYWGDQYDVYYDATFDTDGAVKLVNLKLEADIFTKTIVDAASGDEVSYRLWKDGFVNKFVSISEKLGMVSFAVYFPDSEDKFLFQAIEGNVLVDAVEEARAAGYSKNDY
ncbi:membrane lipoprotein lipid attachment site-containing protein [Enterococcus mediterraneensis]|uniref:membrane lipoprotein lipid attachment site-containing protein n=1 Tax=Enterococcus mediterraneensis TaxID=2364791 RepID=UPI000F050D83|nr:membrane lipoprotein lipid attachment site-containing protein [Enterococcus mediterraneensis]